MGFAGEVILTAVAERAGIKIALAVEAYIFAEVEAWVDTGFEGLGRVSLGDGCRGYERGHAGKGGEDGLELHF